MGITLGDMSTSLFPERTESMVVLSLEDLTTLEGKNPLLLISVVRRGHRLKLSYQRKVKSNQ
jgi:hypothetical protein